MLAIHHHDADDRERFADLHAAERAAERAKHLRAIMGRMEALMGSTIAAGQRLIEDAHYAGADFGGNGPAFEMTNFRGAIEDAFSGPLETVRLSMEDDR